jgi:hypothetical protein
MFPGRFSRPAAGAKGKPPCGGGSLCEKDKEDKEKAALRRLWRICGGIIPRFQVSSDDTFLASLPLQYPSDVRLSPDSSIPLRK